MNALIGYVSKTGTTEEIATHVGAALRERRPGVGEQNEWNVTILPLSEINSVQQYDRVLLGAPINGMKVLPELKTFIAEKIAGSNKPVDLFIVSYMFERGRKMWKNAISKEVERVRSLANASSARVFGGRIASPLPGFARFIFGIPKDSPLDQRDWKAIDEWTEAL